MIKKILIGGFWALVLLPNLLFMLAGGKGDGGGTENRTLAEFPVFEADTYETFPSAVDSYINDHAAFRNRFLSANSVLNLKLFGYADNQDVIRGKDGWYFFAGGMSLYDALGTEPFYPDDVAWIGNQIIRAADYYERRGIPFIVMIPPNTEGVYREYMPDCYGRVWEGNRPAQLEEYLREHSGITVLDPREYFNANRDYTWYYKTDTHWNFAGGYVGTQMIIEALGGTPVPIEDVTVTYEQGTPGDLVNLFHLPERFCSEENAVVTGYRDELTVNAEDVNGDKNILHMSTPGAPDKRRIAVIRDSFGTALMDKLPRYFANVDFYHWQAFDYTMLEENPPDAIVYQIVERDLTRIPQDVEKMLPPLDAE